MKDNIRACQHTLSNDVEYKEVVVIGNGPSGMVTSFMLAGNVPYLTNIPEDLPIDDMLRARLSNLPAGQSLYETDLLELAEGLEGRSQNPIPLLMDSLLRPCADLGIQADPLIEWKYDIEKQIDHIVLGRGPPGGAWHSFPARVRTLSPAAWLSLPPHRAGTGSAALARLPARAVAEYCTKYVQACNLTRYFRNGVVVTSVRPWHSVGTPCGPSCPLGANFCISGYESRSGRAFRYVSRRVVAGSGAARAAALQPHVARHALHELAALQRTLHNYASAEGPQPPVLIVGSGVSAADAVWLTLRANLHALHLHRTPAEALARLSPQTYPDYCQVYKMMCDGASGNYTNYTSYPEHVIIDVVPEAKDTPEPGGEYDTSPKRVKLLNLVTNEVTEVIVSIIAVLIGSKPDLFFLQTNFTLSCIDIDCIKCTEEKIDERKRKIDDRRQSFLKDNWLYLKSVLGQSIQSCKSRLNYTEINGNTDTKCVLPDCNKRIEKCTCNLISKYENGVYNTSKDKGEYDTDYKNCMEAKFQCQCLNSDSYSNGIGFGIDPKKPVDGRSNPVAIDKSTHELLYAPKGIYALGPLTADNFVRFIPGGALALVTHIHKEKAEAQ